MYKIQGFFFSILENMKVTWAGKGEKNQTEEERLDAPKSL